MVSTSLLQGALTWVTCLWFDASNPTSEFLVNTPKDPRQMIFRCADGQYVQLMMGTPGFTAKLYGILKIPAEGIDTSGRGVPAGGGDPRNYFGDIDLLQSYISRWKSKEFLEALWAAAIAADRVLLPGECWDDPQVRHNGIIHSDETGIRFVGFPIKIAKGSSRVGIENTPVRGVQSLPLRDVKIVDMGSFVAGPYASTILGDLGAEVIKIEPLTGDPLRVIFRQFVPANRGKRAIRVDAKTPEGAEVVRRICADADIVHHNFRPGVAVRLHVDAATLSELKKGIIVLESSAYGPDGPKAALPGFDMGPQALCGHELRAAGEGNSPHWNRCAIVDYSSARLGAIGMLLALLARKRHGVGATVSVNLLDTGIFIMSELIQNADGQFAGAPTISKSQTGFHPAERFYQARDGWIAICARSDGMARRLAAALNLKIPRPRRSWGEQEAHSLVAAIRKLSMAEALEKLAAHDVWAEPCEEQGQTCSFAEERLRDIGMVFHSDHDEVGRLTQIGQGFCFSRSLLRLSGRGRPPKPGEHTGEILREAGYSPNEIERLFGRNIVA
jgi:crotonobetainyl-CoA:carnitine CoA-transferase CaiB-like acyl-CoA transferase